MLQLILIFYFLSNYLLHFYISENKLIFAFNRNSFFDYISCLPTLLVLTNLLTKNDFTELSKVTRFFSIYRFEKILARNNMEGTYLIFKDILISF